MKLLLKLGVLLLAFAAGLYWFAGYDPEADRTAPSKAQTQLEQHIETSEDSLTRTERIRRLFAFPAAVRAALDARVPAEHRVKADEIAPVMKQALVATEDKRFYDHGAVDIFGISRAFYTNLIAGHTVEGGSTITQQLVKNLFLSSKRILSRKVEEIILAYLMEYYFTKDEILTMYLNSIYYGNSYYGLKAAADGYFATTPKELTTAQAALLAGLPQAPTYYNPKEHFSAAKDRQRTVLTLMKQQGMLSRKEADRAFYDDLHLQK